MTTTTYYDLNIVEGTDIVNPLTVDNPNYEAIDEAMHDNAVAGVTLATEIANATVHAITRENSECAVIRFIATSEWKAGDTVTVDGVPVTALLPSGETLPDGAYVINTNVLCILTGTNLTIYAERKKAENANEIAYNDTTVGAELVRLDEKIDTVDEKIDTVDESLTPLPTEGIYVVARGVENGFQWTANDNCWVNVTASPSAPGYLLLSIFNGDVAVNNTQISTNATKNYADVISLPMKKGQKIKVTYVGYTNPTVQYCV